MCHTLHDVPSSTKSVIKATSHARKSRFMATMRGSSSTKINPDSACQHNHLKYGLCLLGFLYLSSELPLGTVEIKNKLTNMAGNQAVNGDGTTYGQLILLLTNRNYEPGYDTRTDIWRNCRQTHSGITLQSTSSGPPVYCVIIINCASCTQITDETHMTT